MAPLRFDRKEEPRGDIIIRVLMILVIIGSLPVVSNLQIPPKAIAQTTSEGAKVLVDDVIEDLKSNNTNKAEVHLSILNQQLPTFVNSTSLESVKVLLDDVTSALKNKNVNSALVHLNLVKQQLTPNGSSTTIPSPPVKESTPPAASSQITNVQANHPPVAYGDNVTVTSGSLIHIKLTAKDSDGDPIKFSIDNTTSFGTLEDFNLNTGDLIYKTSEGYNHCDTCTDQFTFYATDSHNATSNTGYYLIKINPQPSTEQQTSSTPSNKQKQGQQNICLDSQGFIRVDPKLCQPSTGSADTTTIPETNNENPSSSGTDYVSICAKLQPVLIPSCSTLVNNDGSLTSDGTHAMHCIRNGILLGGGAALFGLPLTLILKGLSALAAPTGCDGIVNMQGFNQVGDISSLSSLTNLLP